MVFGGISDGETRLNEFGSIVEQVWADLPGHYFNVQCDAFVVMPNHIHGVIVLDESIVGAGFKPAPTRRHGVPEIVRALKTFSARTRCAIPPARPCGNATTTNMSSVATANCCASVNILSTTPWIGTKTGRIRCALPDLKPVGVIEPWQV